MSSKSTNDYFSRGEVRVNHTEELRKERERAARELCDAPSSSQSTPRATVVAGATSQRAKVSTSAIPCPQCHADLRLSFSLRDIMNAVRKIKLEGIAFCHDCHNNAFPASDVGMQRKVAYCRVCELVICPSCCNVRQRQR